VCVVCISRTGSDRGLMSLDASICELDVSGVSASIMHTDILSFHVDVVDIKGDDEQYRGGVDA
jgi:hypothetical protein